jgi:hypothetical protein
MYQELGVYISLPPTMRGADIRQGRYTLQLCETLTFQTPSTIMNI